MEESEKKKDEKILAKAIKRFENSRDAFKKSRENAKTALDFRNLNQWPESIRKARETDPDGARPCLVVDKLGQYVHQIVNDFRQQKLGIEVLPVDGGADIEVAEIYQDLIRRIENQSTASQAYNWAFQSVVESGEGFWRVVTDYETENSFNQEIFIKKIPDIFSVYFDPAAIYTDGRDADWVFLIEDMDRSLFEEQYGKEGGEFSEQADTGWVSENRVRVAEYFYKEKIEVEIGINQLGLISEILPESDRSQFTKIRKTKKTIVKWCKLTSGKILEKGIWPSKYLPIVRIAGDEHRIQDEGIFYQGMIYPSVDAQRMYNYAASSFVETVALSPKAPFVAAAGQIENFRDMWSQANTRNFSVLEYDPITINGTLAPPPQRMEMPGVPQGWQFVQQNMLNDVQQSLGLYQAYMGQEGNERTGAAISQRKTQGEHSQFHFFDNASMAIEQTGRIIVDLIPKIYDTPKVMKIRGEDGMIKQVFINPEMQAVVRDKINAYKDVIGREINPNIGNYDVVISTGPSSATKREETAKSMFALASQNPEIVRVGGDILVKNMDFPGSQELAARIYRTIPGNITNPDPEVTPEMAQLMDQNKMLMEENAMLKSGAQQEMAKAQLESQTKIESTKMVQENENIRTQAKLENEKEIAMLQEAGRVKSSKISSKNEIIEQVVANRGKYREILIKKGYPLNLVEETLNTFQSDMKGELLDEVGVTKTPVKDIIEESIEKKGDIDEFETDSF